MPSLPRLFWPVALSLAFALTALLMVAPMVKMAAHGSTNTNEGWNAYYQRDALQGKPLYSEPVRLTGANYPPVSFHLIGFLSRFTGNINQTGRWVSLISLLLVAALCGAIVWRETGSRPLAVYTALSVLIWLAVYEDDRIAMNDPQLLGTVFSLLGLYLYLARPEARPEKTSWFAVSALAFTLSVFIKHNLIAYPAAVGLHLLWNRKWKALVVWGGVLAAASALFLLLTSKIDGPYLIAHLLTPRPQFGWLTHVTEYLSYFQAPIAVAVVWSLRARRASLNHVLVFALITAHLIAIAFAGGYGVARNIFFDSLFMLIIVGSLAFHEFSPLAMRSAWPNFALAALLVVPSLGVLIEMGLNERYTWVPPVKSRAQDFDETVELLRSHPGQALCMELLACFEAGKPLVYESFAVNAALKTGRLEEKDVLGLLEREQFSVIQLDGDQFSTTYTPLPSAAFAEALAEHYRVEKRFSRSMVLVPKH